MRFLLRMAVWVLALLLGALRPVLFGFHRWMIQEPRDRIAFVLRKVRGVKGAGVRLQYNDRSIGGGHGMVGSMALAVGVACLFLGLAAVTAGAVALAVHGIPDLHASSSIDAKHVAPMLAAVPIVELRQARATLVKQANEALDAVRALAKKENRSLTADENKAQDDWDLKIAAADEAVVLEEKKLDRERKAGAPGRGSDITPAPRVEGLRLRAEDDPARGYRTPAEFMLSVMHNSDVSDVADIDDERLRGLATRTERGDKVIGGNLMAFVMPNAYVPQRFHATVGSDEQGGYSDRFGGFLRPEQTIAGLLQTSFEGDPTDGRTQAVPMGAPTVKFNARVDKDHSSSVSGGFTFTRKPEAVAAAASRGSFEQVTLQATTLTGLAYATDEIMTDSPMSFAQIIASGFSEQLGFHLFSEKMRGLGGSEFAGLLSTNTNPALLSVAKESNQLADTLVTNNCSKMVARCWGYDNAIWLANHTLLPQLASLSVGVGTAGALVWMTDVTKGFPATLFGRPIYFTELCSAVGDAGDIMLVNMSQYLEGTYQPVQSASSVHVRWVQGETAFKTWLRNAAAPWWRTALTPKYGDTRSPFVTLDAR